MNFVSNPCIARGCLSNKAYKLFTNCLKFTRISMHILKSQGILDQSSLPSVVENEGASILVGLFWAPNFTTQVLWISGVRFFFKHKKSENPMWPTNEKNHALRVMWKSCSLMVPTSSSWFSLLRHFERSSRQHGWQNATTRDAAWAAQRAPAEEATF